MQIGDILFLSGPLGSGKTALAKGVISACGFTGEVPSPTFPIVQYYDPPEVRLPIAHVDLYRIEDAEEIPSLGLDEVPENGAMIVEWPDLLGAAYRRSALQLALEPGDNGERILTAQVPAAWETRWPVQ